MKEKLIGVWNRYRPVLNDKYQKVRFYVKHNQKKVIVYSILAVLLFLILTPIVTYLYFVRDLASKESIMTRKNAGIILQDRTGQEFFSFYEARSKKTVPLSQIPKYTQQAVIASEDKDFYSHPGFSIIGVLRAIVADVKNQSISQGGSTISQQLVKTTLLTPDRNFLRKYQELVLALEIERRFSKEDILEMYLNTAYFGEGAFGIQDAAKTYFNKDAKNLTLPESALLAGLLPAPSAYSPINGDPEKAEIRKKVIFRLMHEQGYIDSKQRTIGENTKLSFDPQIKEINTAAPHFALMVKEELIREYGEQKVAKSGFVVKTTLDLELQQYAQDAIKQQVTRLSRNKVTNGASVIMDAKSGEILSLVGSHDWFDSTNGKINMALRPRQPGSSFKPIIYANALEEKLITSSTIIDDKKITFSDGYTPKNYDNKYRGKVTVRYALANSLNIPAVLVMEKVGVKHGIEFAEDLGISTLDVKKDYGLPLVLGAAEVPLVEMTHAYSAFANKGNLPEIASILEIKDKKGKVIFTFRPESKQVLNSGVAFLISSILSDNSARADTFGGALTISRPAAVKTGTTEDYRDALTIGYSPQIVVGVWIGNNDRVPMDNIAGSLGAAPIWRLLITRALIGKPIEKFEAPLFLDKVLTCFGEKENVRSASSSAFIEYYLVGTAPKRDACITPTPEPSATPNPTETPKPTETPAPTQTPVPTEILATPTEEPTPTDVIPLP